MVAGARLICASAALEDGGDGVRFEVDVGGQMKAAFVIRHAGRAHAYLNRCAHVPVELDWMAGKFFDFDRQFLICAVHGALYAPASGRCLGGPCRGGRLTPLAVYEREGQVWLAVED